MQGREAKRPRREDGSAAASGGAGSAPRGEAMSDAAPAARRRFYVELGRLRKKRANEYRALELFDEISSLIFMAAKSLRVLEVDGDDGGAGASASISLCSA